MGGVFVDQAQNKYGRMIMCHMFSPDLERLHDMADRIGVARKWFQNPLTMPKVSWPHYDIAQSKRALAVSFGAIECDRYCMLAVANIIRGRDPLRNLRESPFAGHVPAFLEQHGFSHPHERRG